MKTLDIDVPSCDVVETSNGAECDDMETKFIEWWPADGIR